MVKRAPARRRPRKAKPGTKGLVPAECRLELPTGAAAEAAEAIAKAGGCVVGSYKEPLGGHPVLLSILPIDAVEPTPFQRDLSDAHHKRLADVIIKTGRFPPSLLSWRPVVVSGLPTADIVSRPCAASGLSPSRLWSSRNAK
jgi:ParB family chromosome partitioning protein